MMADLSPAQIHGETRPGLAYQYAFDWLAVHLHAARGPAAYGGDVLWHAAEMLRRAHDISFLAPCAAGLQEAAAVLGVPVPAPVEPGTTEWAAIGLPVTDLSHLRLLDSLGDDGRLLVVAAGPLMAYTAEKRHLTSGTLLNVKEVLKALPPGTFRVVERLDLNTPAAIGRHLQSAAALKSGRRDLYDRYQFAMRRDIKSQSPRSGLGALVCLALERAA